MACAIVFDEMLRRGEVTSYRELAEIAQVSPARLSQVMALLDLCPQVQQELVLLATASPSSDRITERRLRLLRGEVSWIEQARLWQSLRQRTPRVP